MNLRALAYAAFLCSAVAVADPTPAPPQNVIRTTVSPDGGTLFWYVDVRGNDSNTCTAPFTDGGVNGPCRQPQAALNKIPKVLRHGVVVSIDAGTYAGAYVEGFTCDPSYQQASGGLLLDGLGAMQNSTLATGTATGTATASSAGSGITYGTLTDGAQTWTVNDLTGRFVTAAGTTRVISSNTATVITIVGTWTNPGAVPYTIQDPGVVINAAVPAPATQFSASSSTQGAGLVFSNNRCFQRDSAIGARNIRIALSSGGGIFIGDFTGYTLRNMQVRSTDNSGRQLETSPTSTSLGGGSGWVIADSDFKSVSSSFANMEIRAAWGNNSISRTLIRGGVTGINALFGGVVTASTVDIQGSTSQGVQVGGLGSGAGGNVGVSGAHIDCSSSSGKGVVVGGTTAQSPPSYVSFSSGQITTCGTALSVNGSLAAVDVAAMSGSVATTGFAVTQGATVGYAKAGVTLTAGTNEVSIDSGDTVGTFAAGTAGVCRIPATTNSGARVCAR